MNASSLTAYIDLGSATRLGLVSHDLSQMLYMSKKRFSEVLLDPSSKGATYREPQSNKCQGIHCARGTCENRAEEIYKFLPNGELQFKALQYSVHASTV